MNHHLREIDIQPTDRVAFIHIPKTAGDTFTALIEKLLSEFSRCPKILTQKITKLSYEEIMSYNLYMGHCLYDQLDIIFPSGFLAMTFLRDPIRRTISQFKYLQRYDEIGVAEWGLADDFLKVIKNMTFDEFLTNNEFRDARMAINTQTRVLGGVKGKDGRSVYTTNKDDDKAIIMNNLKKLAIAFRDEYPDLNSLDIAKKRLNQIAFLGITERFQDSLFLLSFTFGWAPIIDSLYLNRGSESNTTLEFSPKTTELLHQKIELDTQLYDFGLEVFDQRFNAMTHILLERYGSAEHKSLPLPLPTNIMVELLQKHYDTRRNHRQQSLLQSIGPEYCYSPNSYAEDIFGWYPFETSNNYGAVCWSGPGLQSGFDLPCPSGENIWVSFRILMAAQPKILDQLSLSVNNKPVALIREMQSNGSYIFTGTIGSQKSPGFIRLIFSVPETIAPAAIDPNNGDSRPLGILLNWVKLFAVSDENQHQLLPILDNTYNYHLSMPFERAFGWHDLENSPIHGPVRWSGPELESGFNLPCPFGENIWVSFRILMAVHPNVLDQLSLSANNKPVALIREMQSDGSYIFTGAIGPQKSAGFVRLIFSVPETIAPASIDPNNGDSRPLGILLNWVKLFAISDENQHQLLPILDNTYNYHLSMPFEHAFGWHDLENSPIHGPVRWSGPELESGFNLPRPPWEHIQISFRILMALQLNIIDGLSLKVNGIPVKLTHTQQQDTSYIFTGAIPADAISDPFMRLVFSVPQTITPSSVDSNNTDIRQLGVLLNWVKLEQGV